MHSQRASTLWSKFSWLTVTKKTKDLVAKCFSFMHLCIWESSEGKDGKAEAPGNEVDISKVMKASVEKCEDYFHRSCLHVQFFVYSEIPEK